MQGSGLPFNASDSDPAADGALVARTARGDNAAPVSVSELAGALKRLVEGGFAHVRVRGEISGFKRAASGHLYLCLKDADAVIDGVMWKGGAARVPFRPEDGLDVIATGRLTTYPGRSKYQIVIESLELAGEGALLALLEKTKARLAAEGLFDPARKQRLPTMPRVIGVVTSPTGAVIRDIVHRLEDRFPTRVIVWPVVVQGPAAAPAIAAAIRGFDALATGGPVPRPDLLIVARGGGSIEDLWAFNEEAVVRAVADCRIPLISAVGHETDTTLIDHASDRRAPTPTAAAEMAVPVRAELVATTADLAARATRAWARIDGQLRERIEACALRLPGLDRLVAPQRQRLDDMGERLPAGLVRALDRARQSHAHAVAGLRPALLTARISTARERVEGLWRLAGSLDPRRMLARGYAMVRDGQGRVLTSAAAARAAETLALGFGDGEVAVTVIGADSPTARQSAARKPRSPAPGQGGLFD